MRRILTIAFALCVCTAVRLLAQENTTFQGEGNVYRVSYSFKGKKAVYDKDYRDVYDDFKLDVSGNMGVFYSENRYVRDSLGLIAYDRHRKVKDNSALNEQLSRRSHGSYMVCFINYRSGKCRVSYDDLLLHVINGKGDLEMPQWEITDSTRVSEEGYTVTKAVARYLGRQWIVWFTQEIPLPYGPWLLFGTPGLIITAYDSSKNFIFRFGGLEMATESRYADAWRQRFKKHSKSDKIHNYPLGSAEKMYTRAKTDGDYLYRLTGVRDLGNWSPDGSYHPPILEYEPLIPSSYWNGTRAKEKVIRKQRKDLKYIDVDSLHKNYQKVLEEVKKSGVL